MKVLHVCMFVTAMALFGGTAFSEDYAGQIDCSVDGEHVFSFDIHQSDRQEVTLDCGMQVSCKFSSKNGGGNRPEMPASIWCAFRQGRAVYVGAGAKFYETGSGISGNLDHSINIPDHNHVLNCRPASY